MVTIKKQNLDPGSSRETERGHGQVWGESRGAQPHYAQIRAQMAVGRDYAI